MSRSESADVPVKERMAEHQSGRKVPEKLQRPHDHFESAVLRRIWNRLNRKNEHFMGCIVGQEGSGKSHTAIRIANEIDQTFGTDRIMFDVTQLLQTLRDGDHEPGNAYVLDEAGVAFGNRTWHDRGQILANQALQLVRSHNLALIFTLPRLSELDSQVIGRLQATFEITDKEVGRYVEGKWKYMDPDREDSSGKIYRKYPRIYRDGQRIRVTRLRFGPPTNDLVEPYEAEKAEYQAKFYDETIQELQDEQAQAEKEEKSTIELAEEIKDDGLTKLISTHGGNGRAYIDKDLVRAHYGLSHREANEVKKLLENDAQEILTQHTQGE